MNPNFTATSRKEFIADIQLTSQNTTVQLPTNGGLIPNDRFMYGMFLTFEGRVKNAGSNNPTGVLADAPFSLINRIKVSGYHRVRGANEPFFDMRGVDLYNLNRIYTSHIPYVTPNSAGAPLFTPSLSTSASASNDIRFTLFLPFTPMKIPVNSQLGWLLDAPNYDQLKIEIQFADDLSIFTYSSRTAPAFTSFGADTGNPRIRVEGQFALAGQSAFGFVPGRVWRYFVENTTGDIVATVSNSRQYNIPRGNKIRGILMKTGTKATGLTAGNDAYTSYSDSILSNIRIQRGLNKSIRFYSSYLSIKDEVAHSYAMYPQSGYALIDFAQRGRLVEALDTVGLIAGPSGDTDLYVQADTAGTSNNASLFVVEELRGIPRTLNTGR